MALLVKRVSQLGEFGMLSVYLSMIDDQDDKDKFEEIYNKFNKYMLHEANKLLNNPYDAEDVVHDTFVDIAKNIKLLRTESDNETLSYLLCATRGHAYNFLNRKKLNYIPIQSVEGHMYRDELLKAESNLDYKNILKIIRSMEEMYSDVLYLYYCVGLNCKEIGQILGRKHATVRKQLSRGKMILISKLKEEGFNNE